MDPDALTTVAQDYLKAIWSRTEWGDAPLTTGDLAARMGAAPATVTETVRRLAGQGLLEYTPYRPVTLTPMGRDCAVAMVRRHRLLETYLVTALGYGWDEVHDEAERLEHAASPGLIERIDRALGHPTADPHGDPIPAADGTTALPEGTLLLRDLTEAGPVEVVRVSDADPGALVAARALGLVPGARGEVRGCEPLTVVVADATETEVPDDVAAAVRVRPVGRGDGGAVAEPGSDAVPLAAADAVPVAASDAEPGPVAERDRADHAVEESIGSPREHWEERYRDAPVWSGSVNATTAAVVERLEADGVDGTGPVAPGRALDLGCGEGADVIWLASRGWDVIGTDISATAVARAADAARAAEAGRDAETAQAAEAARAVEAARTDGSLRVRFIAQDLEPWAAGEGGAGGALEGPFDLVTASFLHSRAALGRTAILRQAARVLAPGGHLLVVSHAAPPPWSRHAQYDDHTQHDDHTQNDEAAGHDEHTHHDSMGLLPPAQEIAALGLLAGQWRTVLAETRTRIAQGPDGQEAVLEDGVILLRRA